MSMDELSYAQAMRDVIKSLVLQEIGRLRPSPSYGRVSAIASDRKTCSVVFPGDTDPVSVRTYTTQPATAGAVGVGDVVRVEGISGDRYVTEVVSGLSFLRAKQASFLGIPTSAGTANAVIDATTGLLTRSTSSERYKKDIETHASNVDEFLKMRAVTFRPKDESDERVYLGLIAEEVAALDDPELNLLVGVDSNGDPESVNYDRVGVALIPIVQGLVRTVKELQDSVKTLEGRIQELENA